MKPNPKLLKNHMFQDIPIDKTREFETIYHFLRKNWNICKWVALGVVILQALIFLLALMVRAANAPMEYDSDDKYINGPRQQRQPLIIRQQVPATGIPVTTGPLDSRPSRNDAWSARPSLMLMFFSSSKEEGTSVAFQVLDIWFSGLSSLSWKWRTHKLEVGVHTDGHGISTDLATKKNISVSRKLAGIWEPVPRSNLVSKLFVACEADLQILFAFSLLKLQKYLIST